MAAPLLLFVFLGSLATWADGGVVKVCSGDLSFSDCSNCCALKKGCLYLEPGTGHVTCIGGDSRGCPRNCEGPKLRVCPANSSGGLGKADIEVLKGKIPPSHSGCTYYNIDNGDRIPKQEVSENMEEKKTKCKIDSAVEVCNGKVSKANCGCCGGKSGCLYLENAFANSTCIPKLGFCPRICLPTVAVCSTSLSFRGTTLESCVNARHSCDKITEGCSLYDRFTGEDLCSTSSAM